MMKKIIIYLFLIGCSSSLFAQEFTGVILDKTNEKPIAFATIFFPELKTGTVSDEQGLFTIEHFNQHKIHIQISYVGYQTLDKTISLVLLLKRLFIWNPVIII